MKTVNVFLLLTIVLLFTSCQSKEVNLDLATNYFPTTSHLQNGIVNKYQSQFVSAKDKEVTQNIFYRSYQLKEDTLLEIKNYNVAGELEAYNVYSFQQGAMFLKEQFLINYGDTIVPTIHQATIRNWKSDTSTFHKTSQHQWGDRISIIKQLNNKDTIAINKPAKLFESKRILTIAKEQDTTIIELMEKEIYVAGLGLFYNESNYDRGHSTMELIEQLSFQDFKKITNHHLQRVAYIDPEKVIDKEHDFKPCEAQAKIFDYYNGQPPAGFNGGKGTLKRAILSKIDTTKLLGESGFLTFRFVINCKGEIGWFTTEQADLNYQKKQFNKETVKHFYEIISQLSTWHPTVIRKEEKDAYAYLTIKLKNGAITDFLP